MKKKLTPRNFPSVSSKEYETGLDKLLVSESHEIDFEAEDKARAKAEKQIGKWIVYDPKNSEAILPTKQFCLSSQNQSAETLLKSIKATAKQALKNKAAPEHIHGLAKNIMRSLHYWGDDLKNSIGKELLVWAALHLGQTYERLLLWENEQPAQSGKRSRAAAQQIGRAAPEGSLRDAFQAQVAGWRGMSAGRLLIIAKKAFPKRTQENLLRQISRLKKGGQ